MEKISQRTMDTSDAKGNTELHFAAHAGNLDQVLKILNDVFNILQPNAAGLTPLHFAAFGGNVEVLQALLSRCPKDTQDLQSKIKGTTLLHEAVRGASSKAIEYLLDMGANTNLQDQKGDTPLHIAASLKCTFYPSTICQVLLEAGANPTIKNKEGENFVLALLKRGDRGSLERLISLALQYQTDLLSRNVCGLTALDKARKISAPANIIRMIQNKTQEEQKFVLNQQPLPFPVKEVGKQHSRYEKKIKLIICGHSGAGKTTFAHTLNMTGLARLQYMLRGSETPLSTQGVSCSKADLKDGSLVIWDFAGQMEYCFTHSLLLNTSGPNTIYCVVFSLKGIESDLHGGQKQAVEQILFWMRFLSVTHNPASTPNVILIGSHLDTLPEEHCSLIANQFYDNVMKRETELFSCFKKYFFPINCKDPEDVKPIREALAEMVAQVEQETEPEICQLIMTHLRKEKVRFLSWQQYVERITPVLAASGYQQICPDTLQTAVEYLHNISELLFLPQTIPSSPGATPAIPSGVVILDVNWLLEEVFARFGNFALSPASGTDREFWSLEEVVGALSLNDVEGDIGAALELLESLELLLQTDDGDFVVPAWLKRRGLQDQPTQLYQKQLRGVGYVYRNDSKAFFSSFFVGKLQIHLLRQFGKQQCKLWKEAACLHKKAQLRVAVSRDKRGLYLIGSWRDKDEEGHCFHLLKEVENIVETLLRDQWNQSYEKLYLCPSCANVSIHSGQGAEEIKGFSFEQILEAEKNRSVMCVCEVQPWKVLFPRHDTRILLNLKSKCRTEWLEASTFKRLCHLLDMHIPNQDWIRLAERLGKVAIDILDIKDKAKNDESSFTSLLLKREHKMTVGQLMELLHEMNRDDCIEEMSRFM